MQTKIFQWWMKLELECVTMHWEWKHLIFLYNNVYRSIHPKIPVIVNVWGSNNTPQDARMVSIALVMHLHIMLGRNMCLKYNNYNVHADICNVFCIVCLQYNDSVCKCVLYYPCYWFLIVEEEAEDVKEEFVRIKLLFRLRRFWGLSWRGGCKWAMGANWQKQEDDKNLTIT